jgi:uncharacterized membrane protein
MVFGHILWDLDYFGLVPMNNLIYSSLQQTVPPLFFLIVGIGLIVSEKKAESKAPGQQKNFYKILFMRGLKILGLGMVLSLVSFILIPDKPVIFGVLHCIGLSIILSIPFLKYRRLNLLFASIILFLGFQVTQIIVNNPTILHFIVGLHQADVWLYTVDYFPLLPWFGICLMGIIIGDILYCGDKRRFRMPDLSKYRPAKMFSWVGQHSLAIYLLHQPIIAGVVSVFALL